MEIQTNEYKRCDVVKITGRIDSQTSPRLSEAFKAINDKGQYKIVCEMSAVDFISSSGLWVLVNAQKLCKRYNRGEIVLTNVPTRIVAAMELAGFNEYFKKYDNLIDAVGNF
jgi:anti-sigma B factor antagonist